MKTLSTLFTLAAVALLHLPAFGADEKESTVKGEILDLTCYADHGGAGEKHAACAAKCISSGLPVGIKGEDGKVYTVVGDHKPLNKELADHAGKTVTLKGKVASKDGVNLLENAELVK
ncbi:MAG: hypothetical protein QOD99_3073 [Chthoniobacter sp.]|jgi:hypothetical protein|nr:hypothetical protein [Chthoniobacter sp.]